MITAILITLLCCISYLIFQYRNYLNRYNDINKIPGPTITDIIKVFFKPSEGLVNFFESLNTKYGPIAKIWIKPMRPIIITTDSEFIDKIYKSNDYFYNVSFAEVKSLFRNSLLTTTSKESWMNDKQIIIKTFTRTFISNHLMGYNKKYDEFIKTIYENLEKPFDVEPHIKKIHAEIMIESMMDSEIKITREEMKEYIENLIKYFDLLEGNANSIGILHKFTNNYRLFLKCGKNVIKIMENLMERHKNVSQHQRAKNNLMYAFMDSGMSDDKIIDNMNLTIAAGLETAVLPISLTLYELGKRPELQEKILGEIISVIGPELTREITHNDLNDMSYLQCVTNEAVRLYFPSPFMDRLLPHDVKIRDMIIPRNTQVIFHLSKIFKSDEYFQNANEFNPDRFLQENLIDKALWFGYGLKSCPGKKIAYPSIKLFLAKIIREFRIYPVDGHEVRLISQLTYKTANGIPVIFKKRI